MACRQTRSIRGRAPCLNSLRSDPLAYRFWQEMNEDDRVVDERILKSMGRSGHETTPRLVDLGGSDSERPKP